MRAAAYARVSSAGQRDRHTIESQLRALPEFIAARGWELVATYVDDGRSAKAGKLDKRTGFTELLRDAAAGRFDVVAVINVDRLTRSEDIAERGAVLGAFQRAGVKIADASSGQVLDLSSSMGDLFSGLQAFFAAEENRKKSIRIKEGKLTAIARGKKPGGLTPYGYRYDRATGAWSVHELEAAIVREVFARAKAGESANSIAEDLHARAVPRPKGGSWNASRVYALLKQTAYRGSWLADKRKRLIVATPRLVEDAAWYAVHDRDAAKARQLGALRRTRHVYLIEGLATCELCGAPIGIASALASHRKNPTVAKYVCRNRRTPTRGTARCRAPYWKAAEVDIRVFAALVRLVTRDDLVERVARRARADAGADTEAWRADLEAAERRLARLAKVEAAILIRFRRETISEAAVDIELEAIHRERTQAHYQIEAARRAELAAGQRISRLDALAAHVADLRARAANASPEKRRELVRALVKPGGVRLSIATIKLAATLATAPAQPTTAIALVRESG